MWTNTNYGAVQAQFAHNNLAQDCYSGGPNSCPGFHINDVLWTPMNGGGYPKIGVRNGWENGGFFQSGCNCTAYQVYSEIYFSSGALMAWTISNTIPNHVIRNHAIQIVPISVGTSIFTGNTTEIS